MNFEVISFIIYFAAMLGIGIFFFFKSKDAGEKDYFLGGRSMGPWVTAMSAQASDMSAWLLMGLPGSIMAFGFGEAWVGIGLALGTAANSDVSQKQQMTPSHCHSISQTDLPQRIRPSKSSVPLYSLYSLPFMLHRVLLPEQQFSQQFSLHLHLTLRCSSS